MRCPTRHERQPAASCVETPLKKSQRSGAPGPSTPVGVLAERAAEALRQERFKEAIELFKLADPAGPATGMEGVACRRLSAAAPAPWPPRRCSRRPRWSSRTLSRPDGTVRDSRLVPDMPDPRRSAAEGGGVSAPQLRQRRRFAGRPNGLSWRIWRRPCWWRFPSFPSPPAPRRPNRRAGANLPRRRVRRWPAWVNGASAEEMERAAQPDIASLRLQAGPPAAQVPHRDAAGRRADPPAAGEQSTRVRRSTRSARPWRRRYSESVSWMPTDGSD